MGRSLMRDRNVNPSQQQYHPYVNSPSTCQRIFEIACLVLILASVPAWLGGVYSIFVTGYGTALGLLGLLSFGTRRHTCSFLVFAILFFIFVIVVIILNAIDPIGKNIPFNDRTTGPVGAANSNGTQDGRYGSHGNPNSKRQTDGSGYCSILANCTLDIQNLGQLDDGQVRLNYGPGASDVSFYLKNGILYDNLNRTCYISGATQLQCNYAPQTNDYNQYCVSDGRLTYGGNSNWYECAATSEGGSNVYTTKYYPQCTLISLVVTSNQCRNTTDGSNYDGNSVTGGAFAVNNNGTNNGTNNTNTSNYAAGVFKGSRVYAYIDSGILLLTTLIAIIAAFLVAKEFRPAPGTLSHTSTTSTTTRPVTSGLGGNTGYAGNAATQGGANYAAGTSTGVAGNAL